MNNQDPIRSRRIPRFVEEYCKDRNGRQAAIRAGYSEVSAHALASRLLADPQVQEMVAAQSARITREVELEAADILREWLDIATADPSKLGHVRHAACRYCHGVGHAYQWSPREYAEACDAAESRGKPPPACDGGFGWRPHGEPHPDCPECVGEGVAEVFIADITTLTGPERKLYAGLKMTANGPEVKMHDQDAARLNLAKYLGMLVERRELTGKGGEALMPSTILVCGPDE